MKPRVTWMQLQRRTGMSFVSTLGQLWPKPDSRGLRSAELAPPAATQLAEQAASTQPDNLEAQITLVRAPIARGDLPRASEVMARMTQRATGVAAVEHLVGMLALAKGDRATARGAFEKAHKLDETSLEPVEMLVTLDLQDGKAVEARTRIEERLTKTPNSSAVLALAGRTWAAHGDPAKAETFLRRSIEADSSNLQAYSDLARLYLSQRRMDEAGGEFDRLALKRPKAVAPPTVAALILQAQGKEAEAQQRLERIVSADPRAAVAFEQFGLDLCEPWRRAIGPRSAISAGSQG